MYYEHWKDEQKYFYAYELVVPLVHTDERYSNEVDEKDIHAEGDSVYIKKLCSWCIYIK